MAIEVFNKTVQVNEGPESGGQLLDLNAATDVVTLRTGSTGAIQYRISGSTTWTRIEASSSAQLEVDLSKVRILVRRTFRDLRPVGVVVRGTKGDATAPALGTGSRLLLIGSSTLEYHTDLTGSPLRTGLTAKGPLNWLNAMAGRPLTLVKNMGVGGYNTTQVLAVMDEALSYRPDVVALHAGTNGLFLNGNTAETEFGAWRVIAERFLSAGCKLIACIPQRWASTDAAYTVAKAQQYDLYVEWIRNYCEGRRNVLMLDFASPIMDPNSTTQDALPNALLDTRHLSNYGAQLVADANFPAFKAFFPDQNRPESELRNLLPDAGMRTSKVSAEAGVTGNVWNNCTVRRIAGSPTATASLVPASAVPPGLVPMSHGSGFALKLVCTAPAANDRLNFEVASTLIKPLFSDGDQIEAELMVAVEAGHVALRALPLYLNLTPSTMNVIDLGRDLTTTTNDKAMRAGAIGPLRLRTPAYAIPNGTTAILMAFSLLWNAAGSATVYIWRPTIRKVPSEPRFYA